MPDAVRVASDSLVGRDAELRSTFGSLRNLSEGHPRVVLVGGPAGIGKSRFAAAVSSLLRDGGTRVMTGACLDLAAGAPPYSALIAAFRSADPPAVDVLDALTGEAHVRRSRLFELLRRTMAALARRRPTVLVVEDLHWSDRITRDALLYLVSMAREGRWALLATYRDDELRARPAVLDLLDAVQQHTLAHVTLDPLEPADVAAQVAGITGRGVPPAHAAAIHRRTGGIPLLVEEVVAAEAGGTTGVPSHLRDLFLARMRRLGTRVAEAVEVVSVVGDGCTEQLV
ncbi:MAG: AAA family ATPase, partial [Actinomycetota bacterium]